MPVENILFWILVFSIFLLIVCIILGIFIFKTTLAFDKNSNMDCEMAISVLLIILGALTSTMFVLGLFSANGYTIGG